MTMTERWNPSMINIPRGKLAMRTPGLAPDTWLEVWVEQGRFACLACALLPSRPIYIDSATTREQEILRETAVRLARHRGHEVRGPKAPQTAT
jgi:hypothetical protein